MRNRTRTTGPDARGRLRVRRQRPFPSVVPSSFAGAITSTHGRPWRIGAQLKKRIPERSQRPHHVRRANLKDAYADTLDRRWTWRSTVLAWLLG